MKRNYFNLIFFILILFACLLFTEQGMDVMEHLFSSKTDKITIVLDAGHGGLDPGKVGVNHALEKDINLSIAYKLKLLLEQNDIHVIMTRESDDGLYTKSDSNWKLADMRRRIKIINSSNAVFAISIHQNSFSQESSKGAQMFYYKNSQQGKILAEVLQESIKKSMNDGNQRLAKANGTYFLLKQSSCPLVIVECGFLSNWAEAKLLCNDAYQEKMAWAIHLGILEYINQYIKNNKANLANQE